MKSYTDDELGPWLALFSVPQLSLRIKHQLLGIFQTPADFLGADWRQLKELGVGNGPLSAIRDYQQQVPDNVIQQRLERALAWRSAEPDHHIITLGMSAYPEALKEISSPPLLLFVIGQVALLSQPQLAMVGSRSPSGDGIRLASQFASQLSHRGLLVTSGLAAGIDGACHRGALQAGFPTVAVMATGIDQIYPKRHYELAQQIRQQGALVTEFPLGQAPRAQNFPQRNRIISGLSKGVLVVEAAIKSGSLITARYALEQNRDVFAIPGSIHNPMTKGCHQLIREGAKLVESVEHIYEELSLQLPLPFDRSDKADSSIIKERLDSIQMMILEKMGFEPVSFDTLVERVEMTVPVLSAALSQLTLLGYVENSDLGFVQVFTGES